MVLDGNDLVFTFEDGSVVRIPLNTLLVGVVKFVNDKAPNSIGQVYITIDDIPNLRNILNNIETTSDYLNIHNLDTGLKQKITLYVVDDQIGYDIGGE